MNALYITINESVDEVSENQPDLGQDEVEQSGSGDIGPTHRMTEGDTVEIYWLDDEECYLPTI